MGPKIALILMKSAEASEQSLSISCRSDQDLQAFFSWLRWLGGGLVEDWRALPQEYFTVRRQTTGE